MGDMVCRGRLARESGDAPLRRVPAGALDDCSIWLEKPDATGRRELSRHPLGVLRERLRGAGSYARSRYAQRGATSCCTSRGETLLTQARPEAIRFHGSDAAMKSSESSLMS